MDEEEFQKKVAKWEDVTKEYHKCSECKGSLVNINSRGTFPMFGKCEMNQADYSCIKCGKIFRAEFKDLTL